MSWKRRRGRREKPSRELMAELDNAIVLLEALVPLLPPGEKVSAINGVISMLYDYWEDEASRTSASRLWAKDWNSGEDAAYDET